MADETVDTGLWIDDETGKVVKKQPRGGATQLVRPGGRLTATAQARIDALEGTSEPETVTTEEAPKKARARKAT